MVWDSPASGQTIVITSNHCHLQAQQQTEDIMMSVRLGVRGQTVLIHWLEKQEAYLLVSGQQLSLVQQM
jgi:hypothetical protein